MNVIKGERGFSASLRVPDDSFLGAVLNRSLNCSSGKELRISHDVLLDPLLFFNISESVFQKHRQSVFRKQRSQHSVRWVMRVLVGNEFRRMLDRQKIIVFKNNVFERVVMRRKQLSKSRSSSSLKQLKLAFLYDGEA